MNEIHDIKPLATIPDQSFFILSVSVVLGVLIVLTLLYALYRFFKKDKTKRLDYIKQLKALDMRDVKASAYTISKYGRLLVKDERSKKFYLQLEKELSNYKYQKEVPAFDKKTLNYFQLFMESIDD